MEKLINYGVSGRNFDTQSAHHHNIHRLNNPVKDKSQIMSIAADAVTFALLISLLVAALFCQDGLSDTVIALKGGY